MRKLDLTDIAHRILYVVCNYSAAMNGISANTEMVRTYTWIEILMPSLIAVFGILALGSLLMMWKSKKKMK